MSEVNKCKKCGKVPDVLRGKHDVLWIRCSGVCNSDWKTLERWNEYNPANPITPPTTEEVCADRIFIADPKPTPPKPQVCCECAAKVEVLAMNWESWQEQLQIVANKARASGSSDFQCKDIEAETIRACFNQLRKLFEL